MSTDRRSGEVTLGELAPFAGLPEAGTQTSRRVPSGVGAARRFIGRVSRLDINAVGEIVATWRDSMRNGADAWLAAEGAVGLAVVSSGRHHEQKPLLVHVADAFAHMVWYGGVSEPELRVHATEASGQYLATVAMLALLVRDHIDATTFELIYRPFAAFIPPAELERE